MEAITLTEIGGGAAIERFGIELQKVLDNIMDPNTATNKARTVVLKVKITPDSNRAIATYSIDAQSKLAPINPHPGHVFLGVDNDGNGVASEAHPQQTEMPEVLKPAQAGEGSTVYHLKKEAKG